MLTLTEICPKLVFLPINFDKYNAKAREVRAVLVNYDPRYEAASVDEAFLNITAVDEFLHLAEPSLFWSYRKVSK